MVVFLSFFANNAQADITSNLRAYYPFNGGFANDFSGNNLHATLTAVTLTAGPFGIADNAGSFNGTSSGGLVVSTVSMTNQQTFSAWIKPTSFGVIRPIVEKADPGWGGEIDCWLRVQPDGKVEWLVNTNYSFYGWLVTATSNSAVALNEWTHIAGVIDHANDQIRLYLNGILEASVSMGGRQVRNTNRVVRIGNRNSNQGIDYFEGALDEVRIYDRALFNTEVQALRNSATAPLVPSGNDFDQDRIPDSWEFQYGLDASVENFRVGSGIDGNLTVNAGQTTYLNDKTILISSPQALGSSELSGVIPIATRIGDVFLMHVTQDGNPAAGAPAGTFELVQIASIHDGKVGLKSPLRNTYNTTTGGRIQCLYVPQYDSLQVNGTVSANPWNGTSGGIIAIIANDVVVSAGGIIDSSGKGFRSGTGFSMYGSFNGEIGTPGEGNVASVWPLPNSTIANNSGGAGGNVGSVGGGGTGSGVSNFGFGGGGGSGGVGATRISSIYGSRFDSIFTSTSGSGGKGGGLLVIISRSIQNGGVITSAGEGGQGGAASGGGGAGGSMLLMSRINGIGTVSAQEGASGDYPSTMGAGAIGKIRMERGVFPSTPVAASTGDGYFDNQSFAPLAKYNDTDGDGMNDYAEYLAGTSPIRPDTDMDGVPDEWEVRFGTLPITADSGADPDLDGLTNIQEYRASSSPTSTDFDNDGISDVSEINTYGTSSILADTDGDGMTDGWEVTNGLNPLLNDANNDRDLDGLTNLEEYAVRAAGYKANASNSKEGQPGDNGLNDYARLKGEGWTRRLYDKNDRLISTERDNGMAQLYTYDGNSQKIRDVSLTKLDADGDGLPDGWEFDHTLPFTGTSAASGDNGANGDPDLDGFTNMQEWQAGTDPRDANSLPNTGAVQVTNTIAAASGFTPTNWVMATGQLDGLGADEVVVGADGAIGTSSNQFSVYRNTGNSWAVTPTNVGSFGINSLAIGEVIAGRGASIYFGARPTSGSAGIQEFRRSGTSWLKSAPSVADSAGTGIAQVVGANSSGVIGLLSPVSQAVDGIYRTTSASDTWSAPAIVSSSAGKRSWPTSVSSGAARWLDAGGIEINAGSPPAVLGAIKNPANGSWYFLSPSAVTWPDAELFATQNGGHLVTVNDTAEQQWIQGNFPSQEMWIGLLRGSSGDGWQWISGASSTYRNWSSGQPDFYGGIEIYGQIYANGVWNDLPPTSLLKGLVEIPASSVPLQTLSDPVATSKVIWRGRSLTSGQLRKGTSSGMSLVYAFIDDKDTSATVNRGDTFVVGEYEMTTPNPVQRTTVALPISSSISSSAIGVTILKRQNSSLPSSLAIGEPDGTVSLWTAPDVGSPLVRKIFTTEFIGKSWHQLEVFREANGAEGLVGLLVDPVTPNQCQLIHWSPESIEAALNGTAPVLNNRPLARVLPTPYSGGAQSTVGIRGWDAEAHASKFTLQFQSAATNIWANARLLSANGSASNLGPPGQTVTLATAPGGQGHTLVWNAAADLGATFSGTVLLRTMAADSEPGAWSEPMPYIVNMASSLDDDGDGFPNATEAAFGTDPNSSTSLPALIATRQTDGSLRLTWPTASSRTYRVEISTNLIQWTAFQSNLSVNTLTIPTTQLTAPKRFYRVAAE